MKPANQMLRDFREKRGVTQTYVEKRAGMKSKRLSYLETGLIQLRVDEFLDICIKGYGVTPQIFFDEELSESEDKTKMQSKNEN